MITIRKADAKEIGIVITLSRVSCAPNQAPFYMFSSNLHRRTHAFGAARLLHTFVMLRRNGTPVASADQRPQASSTRSTPASWDHRSR
jgi:hypothetical protein